MDELGQAWKDYADACCSHDALLGHLAAGEIHALIPAQALRNEVESLPQDDSHGNATTVASDNDSGETHDAACST